MINLFLFYTTWALFLHILSYYKFIGSTRVLAIYILSVSIILFWIYPGYYLIYYNKGLKFIVMLLILDIITHYLPLFVVPKGKTAYKEICIMTILYLIYMRSDILKLYSDPMKYTKM